MQKHEKLTKREKIVIIGATVVTTCIAGYFGYKHFSDSKQIRRLTEDIGRLTTQNLGLEDSVDTLMAAASEGAFEEALGTVNHKITYRTDKEKYVIDYLSTHPNDVDAQQSLERIKVELNNLFTRKHKFEAAQQLYEIKNED